jgi:hypothetical protein
MPLATYSPTWETSLLSSLNYPLGNPAYANAKYSFVKSIVTGITLFFTGKPVTTVDDGQSYNQAAGVGTGQGLTGFLLPAYQSAFQAEMSLVFKTTMTQEGIITMNAIGNTFMTALQNISISTTHPNVTVGDGTAKIDPPLVASALQAQLYSSAVPPVNQNPLYSRWFDYSGVIAKAIVAGSSALTGSVVITGVTTVPPPPTTVPIGAGTGTIS